MRNPGTIYEVLQLLRNYHDNRHAIYKRLADETTDAMAQILLEHLIELEEHSLTVVRHEMANLDPRYTTYMITGPVVSDEAMHASDCNCEHNPTFRQTLACALDSDCLLDELLCRLEGCSAAPSVLNLAKRLRDLEETKDRQIANFTRQD